MPTTRPRHFVTESDALAEALDAGEKRWPELSRAQVLVRLALEADHADRAAREDRRSRRLIALRESSGLMTGVYAPDELERLREDWPE